MTESFEQSIESILDNLKEELSHQHSTHPDELFVLPLTKRPFFPGMAAPLLVEPGPFYEALKTISQKDNPSLALLMTKKEEQKVYEMTLNDLHSVGVLAQVLRIIPMEQGGAQVILNIEKRLTVVKDISTPKHLHVQVELHEEKIDDSKELKAYAISIISSIKELLKLNPLFKEELQIFLSHSDFAEPGKLADFGAALTTASRDEMQGILETFDVRERIDKALLLLAKELDISQLKFSISQKIEASVAKTQKEFFLREQLKTIKRELGIEREDKVSDKEKFEKRLSERKVPPAVMKVIQEEMDKFSVLEAQSAEYGVCRGYLDWLTIIPWGLLSSENTNINHAETVLDEDHYGLEDIKKRILEFISVGHLSGGVKGSILCLVGPPGVGKTSIGKSIARALNRPFYRFSVGGMRDEAEIKGHRRTYVGAMPGKLVQALKTCQSMNPVIMLDEIDKMGKSYHGDPTSALLEVLDPEQNHDFLDHYLDVRVDLSNVLFILTANMLDSIPAPLLDRMEILRLSGYVLEEKVQIAKKYLVPRHRKEMGLSTKDVVFSDDAIKQIIHGYAREAGVRSLENKLKQILRQLALKIVREKQKSKKKSPTKETITGKSIVQYLGKPPFTSERIYQSTPAGVATGLAWTAMGGAILYIETIQVPHEKTGMKLTGQAGDVMKESAQIAWNYLHSALSSYAPRCKFFEKTEVHMHIPEGATPKDGPSAGVTMVTALLSLLLNKPVHKNLGMTGEITLTGRVLPIGGVKEKLVAAKRGGLKTLIFPKENERDLTELPKHIKAGLTIHLVSHYDEIFPLVFRSRS